MNQRFASLLLACLVSLSLVHAQWVSVGGTTPYRGGVIALAVKDSVLYAGTTSYNGNGCYRSTDNGVTWTAMNSGLVTPPYNSQPMINCFGIQGRYLFAGTASGVYRALMPDGRWESMNAGFPRGADYVKSIVLSGSTLVAGAIVSKYTGGGVYTSTDSGTTWTAIDGNTLSVNSMALKGSTLFAGTFGSVSRTRDGGKHWDTFAATAGLPEDYIDCLVVQGSTLLAGTWPHGISSSTDEGQTWTQGATGFPADARAMSFLRHGSTIFAASFYHRGVFFSTNSGEVWTTTGGEIVHRYLYCLAENGPYLFVGSDEGLWRRPLVEMIDPNGDGPVDSGGIPSGFTLRQNYPNPFNGTTRIEFAIPVPQHVMLDVSNLLGQRVAILVDGDRPAGVYTERFSGDGLSSGIYICRLTAGSYAQAVTLVLIR